MEPELENKLDEMEEKIDQILLAIAQLTTLIQAEAPAPLPPATQAQKERSK